MKVILVLFFSIGLNSLAHSSEIQANKENDAWARFDSYVLGLIDKRSPNIDDIKSRNPIANIDCDGGYAISDEEVPTTKRCADNREILAIQQLEVRQFEGAIPQQRANRAIASTPEDKKNKSKDKKE